MTGPRRLLPHPGLSLVLALCWLALNAPVAGTTLAMAALVGLLVPLALAVLDPDPVRLRAPGTALRLLGTVLLDVVRSNVEVAAVILAPARRAARRAGFVSVPLAMRDRTGLAVLAIVLSSIPGTLWVDYDAGRGRLLMHVLDLGDADAAEWADRIKRRYEAPLMEIFR